MKIQGEMMMDFKINFFKVSALIIGAILFFIYFSFVGFGAFEPGIMTLTVYLVIAIFVFPFVADTFSEPLRKKVFLRSILYIVLYAFAPFIFIALLIFPRKDKHQHIK